MSKRAADAALKAYPDCKIKNYPSRTIYLSEKARCNDKRQSFILGYEQAEIDLNKELMDRMAEINEKIAENTLKDIDYGIVIQDYIKSNEAKKD